MKTLITKANGSAMKSKIHAVAWLEKKGLDKSSLIEENGQFYYETAVEQPIVIDTETVKENIKKLEEVPVLNSEFNWETPVFTGAENTKLSFKKNIDVDVILVAKHPAGQSASRPYNAIEVKVGNANSLILPVDLAQNLFEVEV